MTSNINNNLPSPDQFKWIPPATDPTANWSMDFTDPTQMHQMVLIAGFSGMEGDGTGYLSSVFGGTSPSSSTSAATYNPTDYVNTAAIDASNNAQQKSNDTNSNNSNTVSAFDPSLETVSAYEPTTSQTSNQTTSSTTASSADTVSTTTSLRNLSNVNNLI